MTLELHFYVRMVRVFLNENFISPIVCTIDKSLSLMNFCFFIYFKLKERGLINFCFSFYFKLKSLGRGRGE